MSAAVSALCGLQDKNERVRRRVMATLGELLFYIATQQQDAANGTTPADAAAAWGITGNAISTVLRLLNVKVGQHTCWKLC